MGCILTYWSSAGHGPSVPSFDPLTQLHHDTWHWPVGRYHRCRPRGSPAQSCQSNHPAPAPAMNANKSTSWSPKVPLMCSVWFILTKGIYLLRKEEGESCHWNIIQLSFKGAGCASTPGHLLDPSTGTVPPDSCHNVASSSVSCSSSRATRVKDAVPDRSSHSEKSREPLAAPAASTLLSKDHIDQWTAKINQRYAYQSARILKCNNHCSLWCASLRMKCFEYKWIAIYVWWWWRRRWRGRRRRARSLCIN